MFERDVDDPLMLIAADQQRARAAGDANAELCVLSTVDGRGNAQARTLVLREVSDEGALVFMSASSPKWTQLAERNGHVHVHWPSLGRQYRIDGPWRALTQEQLQAHWQQRPWASKVLDWYYEQRAQGTEIDSREALEAGVGATEAALRAQHRDEASVPMPPLARGIRVIAHRIEAFSLSDRRRLHDCRLFERDDSGWRSSVRVP